MKHFLFIWACSALGLALQFAGPPDDFISPRVLAMGGLDNCNSSDHEMFDCVEIGGRTDPCPNVQIAASSQQTCKDELTESTTICTDNNCQNETKDKMATIQDCVQQGCGE